jgi:NAD(P)-dependent dehydrogenase (short-subunit alcohol dehydrogenase family)
MPLGPLLPGKVALITGAGAGIGAEAARLFASEGATVVVADIDGDAAASVLAEIEAAGGAATAHTIDVRDGDQVLAMRDRVLADHGRVDILVNNVGHWINVPPSFLDGGPEHWQALYEVNLLHVFSVTYAFVPSMLAAGRGTIVNVSSIEGMRGYPADSVYAAFKAAVVHFTKSLGVELAPKGIKINGIAPDLTNTEQSNFLAWDPPEYAGKWSTWSPLGRLGVPSDQAKVLLFLASDLSDFLVGHTVPTDAGTAAAAGWFQTTHRPGRSWTNRPLDP